MSRGFIAVSRGVFDHPMFAPEPYTEREAWLWMIEQAAWKETKARVGRTWIALLRGQLAFATRFLAEKWKWSEARVRRLLKRLQSDAMIVLQPTRDATLITICNYDKYQGARRADDAPTDAQPVTGVTRPRRKEEELKQPTTLLRSGARKRATRIADDWEPSSEDQEFAKGLGLKDAEIDRQAARFLDFWKSKPGQGGTKLDWPATWRNWIRTEAEKLGRSPPETSTPCVKNKFYAEFGTAQLDAWDAHNRQTKGASLPRDKRGGWLVDAEWPPGARDSPQEPATSMN